MLFVNGEQVVIQYAETAGIPTVDRGTLEVEGAVQAELRLRDTSQTAPAGRYRLRSVSDTLTIDRAAASSGNPWDSATTLMSFAGSGALTLTVTDVNTDTTLTALTLNRNVTSGAGAASLGVRLALGLESTTTINTLAAAIDAVWTTATHATRTADLIMQVVVSATTTEAGRIDGSGSAWVIGNGDGGLTAPTGWTLRAPDVAAGGAGNVAGADLTIAAGLGTGTGDEGTIIFQLPIVAAAGDNIQTRATRMTLDMVGSSTVLTMSTAQALTISTATGALGLTSTDGAVNVVTGSGAADDFTVNATMLVVEGDNGRVGIGTAAPQSLLDVQGAAGAAGILTLATKELTVVATDELGRINFNAPLESDGGDAILVGAAIWAVATDTFSATVNTTDLVFATAVSEAAAEKMRLTSAGNLTLSSARTGDLAFTVNNTSSGAATDHASVDIIVTNTSADPSITLQTAATQWYMGVDNNEAVGGDTFFIGTGTAVGTNGFVRIRPGGVWAGESGASSQFAFITSNMTVGTGAGDGVGLARVASATATISNQTQRTSLFSSLDIGVLTLTQTGGAVVVNKATGGVFVAPTLANVDITLSMGSGLRILNATKGETATYTAQAGIYIEDMTAGAADYGIVIEGADTACIWISSAVDTTDAANGIAFGLSQDTNLYRSAANTLKTDDSFTVGGGALTFGAAADVAVPAATAAALEISNGTVKMLAFDTRATTDNIQMLLVTSITPTFASAAASTYHLVESSAFVLTLTGQVAAPTDLRGLVLSLGAPTVTDTSAITPTRASTVYIPAITYGGSVTPSTTDLIIDTSVAGCYLTAAGVWTDASTRTAKQDIRTLGVDVPWDDVLKDIQEAQSVSFRKIDPSDGGWRRYGVIAEDVPDYLAMPDRQGVASMYLAGAAFAGVQALIYENEQLKLRIAKLEGARA